MVRRFEVAKTEPKGEPEGKANKRFCLGLAVAGIFPSGPVGGPAGAATFR